ncbi:hypothetical protein KTH_27280 [Thermosporothrix hazakensis]|nr:hypothetical protein KTH_27280 [Thermosporothrix hazakensis]
MVREEDVRIYSGHLFGLRMRGRPMGVAGKVSGEAGLDVAGRLGVDAERKVQ